MLFVYKNSELDFWIMPITEYYKWKAIYAKKMNIFIATKAIND